MKRKLFSKMLLVGLMLCVGAIVHPADGQSDTDTKEKEAMLIQAACRGALARQNQTAEEKNQQGQEREQDTAATTVQAACRGFLSREELAESVNIGALPGAGELPSFIASNSSESSGTDTSSEYSDEPDNKNQSSNVLQELNLDQELDNLLAINDQDTYKALTYAFENNLLWAVRPLLQRDIQASWPNYAVTPLHYAVFLNHLESVRYFLAQVDIDIDAQNRMGQTALMLAAMGGSVAIAELLLTAGANVDVVGEGGRTALMLAAESGIDRWGRGKHEIDIGETRIAELLLDKNAIVDVRDSNGSTALVLAATNGHAKIVNLLLAAGADIDTTNRDGWAASLLEAGSDRTVIAQLLSDRKSEKEINVAVIERLVIAGADVNATFYYPNASALMLAVFRGDNAIVKLLLDRGANIDFVNEKNDTALKYAVLFDKVEITQMLIDGYRRQLAQLYPGILLQITDEDLVQFDKNATVQSVGCAFNQVGEIIAGWMADEDRMQFEKTQCRLFTKSAINGNSTKSQAIKEKLFDVFINSVLQKCSERPIDPEKREKCEKREKIIALLHEALRQGHVPIVSAAQPVCAMTARELNKDSDANIAGPAPRALDCAVAREQARNNDGFALLLEDQQREVDGGAASQEDIAADRKIRAQQDEEYAKSLAIDRQRSERQVMLEREHAETAAQELALGREREDEVARIAAQEREDAANRPRSIEELRARRLAALDGNNATEKDGGSSN